MDKVGIWNLALGHLRAAPAGSLSEFSAAAMACNNFYDLCRDMILVEAPWRFATAWRPLARLSETVPGWAYAYALPADCVRLWKALPALHNLDPLIGATEGSLSMEYEATYCPDTGTEVLATNSESVVAKVTLRVPEARFPPLVCSALGHLLASHIAVPIAGMDVGLKLQNVQLNLYTSALAAATVVDASHQNLENRVSRYEAARR